MPDYNPAVALGLQPPENNLAQTFSTIANLQQSQAHTGLYTLQAAQQQRQLNALRAYANAVRTGGNPLAAYSAEGGDPGGLNTLQNATEMQTEMERGGGLSMASVERATAAAKNRQETSNLGVQHGILQTEQAKKDMEFRGNVAQSLAADPSDANWNAGIASLRGHISPQGQAQIDAATKDPTLRPQVARSMIAAAMPTAEATRPQAIEPGVGYKTPLERISTSGGGTQPVSLAVKEEQTQRGKYLGELPGKLSEDANNAQQQNFVLDQMRNESASWPMGKGAETLMKAQQYFKPIANAFGNTSFDKPVADFENFEKNSGVLVRSAVKEVSSRAAVQEFNLIQKQLPSAGMSRQGFNNIADQFSAVNDFRLAKQSAGTAWGSSHGTMEGFEADWNKNVSPTAFLVHRMSPEQLHEVAAGLQGSVEGRATLASIKRQMEYAQKAGLF